MNNWERTSTELNASALASIDSAVVLYRELEHFFGTYITYTLATICYTPMSMSFKSKMHNINPILFLIDAYH